MDLSRRHFIILSATALVGVRTELTSAADAPTTAGASTSNAQPPTGVVDAGPMTSFPPDTVYDGFRQQGFFIIHRDKELVALSSICTHKKCKVQVEQDQSYLCKCHGSRFDKHGKVTKGPAVRDLPHLAVATDDAGHLLVDPAHEV